MPHLTTDDGVKIYYEEVGAGGVRNLGALAQFHQPVVVARHDHLELQLLLDAIPHRTGDRERHVLLEHAVRALLADLAPAVTGVDAYLVDHQTLAFARGLVDHLDPARLGLATALEHDDELGRRVDAVDPHAPDVA